MLKTNEPVQSVCGGTAFTAGLTTYTVDLGDRLVVVRNVPSRRAARNGFRPRRPGSWNDSSDKALREAGDTSRSFIFNPMKTRILLLTALFGSLAASAQQYPTPRFWLKWTPTSLVLNAVPVVHVGAEYRLKPTLGLEISYGQGYREKSAHFPALIRPRYEMTAHRIRTELRHYILLDHGPTAFYWGPELFHVRSDFTDRFLLNEEAGRWSVGAGRLRDAIWGGSLKGGLFCRLGPRFALDAYGGAGMRFRNRRARWLDLLPEESTERINSLLQDDVLQLNKGRRRTLSPHVALGLKLAYALDRPRSKSRL